MPQALALGAFLTQRYVKLRSGFTNTARCLLGSVVLGVWPQALALGAFLTQRYVMFQDECPHM